MKIEPKEKRKEQFTSYVIQEQKKLYTLAYHYVKNEEIALDMLQNAIEKGYRKIETLREEKYMQTWFYRILINECLNEIKRNKTRKVVNIEDYDIQEDGQTEEAVAIYQLIDALEPKLKTVIWLRFFEDRKIEEIASITKTNISTVKSRLYKALKDLKSEMGELKK